MRIFVYKIKCLIEEMKKISIHPFYLDQSIDTEVDNYDVLFMPADAESLELAKHIKGLKPKLNIIFVSNNTNFCFSAIQIHASGYLVQPVKKEDIQVELDNLRYGTYSRVFIRCFGNFDVIGDGMSVPFKRKKCKELLAYLIYYNGNTISMDELCQVLFNEVSNKKITYLYVLKSEILRALQSYGVGEIVRYQNNGFVVDLKLVECDYIQYIEGKHSLYHGEFMNQYKWAVI